MRQEKHPQGGKRARYATAEALQEVQSQYKGGSLCWVL
jgi:hypothetical protein